MIEVQNLTKKFDQKIILNDMSFKVEENQVLVVLGESGAGKSILLKSIIGLISPTAGSVLIEGNVISEVKFKELQNIRSKIGMVFQFGALIDSLSVKDNILLALKKLTNLDEEEISYRVENVLEQVGLNNNEDSMPSDLSGGMKKRAGIARAICYKPDYLLFDEPTSGLDPISSESIIKLIKKVTSDSTSIIVTHDLKIARLIADQILMIKNGSKVFEGSRNDFFLSDNSFIKKFINSAK
jgi:phospholipid/cholesterol/gamma-HCH transport system ATP-binding protein